MRDWELKAGTGDRGRHKICYYYFLFDNKYVGTGTEIFFNLINSTVKSGIVVMG